MTETLTIRDETLGAKDFHSWAVEVTTERLTVRELIRSRVYQEVQDYNVKQTQEFRCLVQPEEAEKSLNGWKLKKPRQLDWKEQFDRAVEELSQINGCWSIRHAHNFAAGTARQRGHDRVRVVTQETH